MRLHQDQCGGSSCGMRPVTRNRPGRKSSRQRERYSAVRGTMRRAWTRSWRRQGSRPVAFMLTSRRKKRAPCGDTPAYLSRRRWQARERARRSGEPRVARSVHRALPGPAAHEKHRGGVPAAGPGLRGRARGRPVKASFEAVVRGFAARLMDGAVEHSPEDRALAIVALCVGGLVVARSVKDVHWARGSSCLVANWSV